MTTLSRRKAFPHVIDSHRWLAVSGCAWNQVGPKATNGAREAADELLPDIIVMIRDCLLLHARSLIKFYLNRKRRETDIILCDFKVSIDESFEIKLELYENPTEVHLLHLTDWRDPEYRDLRCTDQHGVKRFRPDWNKEANVIVESIHDALRCASEKSGRWQEPFKRLYDACDQRYRNKLYQWPPELGHKSEEYLTGLGL